MGDAESYIKCPGKACQVKIEDDSLTGLHLIHPVLPSVSLPHQSVTHMHHVYRLCLTVQQVHLDQYHQNLSC